MGLSYRISILTLIGVMGAALANAMPHILRTTLKPDQKQIIGFEFELEPKPLANLLRYFDTGHESFKWQFDQIRSDCFADPAHRAKYIPDAVLAHYLENPKALAGLPPEIRAELTEGLDLSKIELEVTPPVGLLGPDGKPAQKGIARIGIEPANQPEKKSSEPKPKTEPEIQNQRVAKNKTGIFVDRETQWNILDERWNKLPVDTKLKLLRFEHLTPERQAIVIFKSGIKFDHNTAKPEYREYFKKLTWGREVKIIEFKLNGVVENTDEAIQLYEDFARKIDRLYELQHPEKLIKHNDFVMHLHLSHQKMDPEVLRLQNIKNSIQIFKSGVHRETVVDEGINTYQSDLLKKGVVRKVEAKHAEFREFGENPSKVLKRAIADYEMDPEAAKQQIIKEIKKSADADFLVKLNRAKNIDLLRDMVNLKLIEKEKLVHIEPETLRQIKIEEYFDHYKDYIHGNVPMSEFEDFYFHVREIRDFNDVVGDPRFIKKAFQSPNVLGDLIPSSDSFVRTQINDYIRENPHVFFDPHVYTVFKETQMLSYYRNTMLVGNLFHWPDQTFSSEHIKNIHHYIRSFPNPHDHLAGSMFITHTNPQAQLFKKVSKLDPEFYGKARKKFEVLSPDTAKKPSFFKQCLSRLVPRWH